jgi:hypothetical protein
MPEGTRMLPGDQETDPSRSATGARYDCAGEELNDGLGAFASLGRVRSTNATNGLARAGCLDARGQRATWLVSTKRT